MKKIPFRKIDAFTADGSAGNPAAVLYPEVSLSDQQMQRIAYELKCFVSEAVFLAASADESCEYQLRYFSCEREVPFCGHGTIAAMYELLSRTGMPERTLRIGTMKGILPVENRIEDEDAVYITAPEPVYFDDTFEIDELAHAMNLSAAQISKLYPVRMVNAGQNVLLVALCALDDCIGAEPDYGKIREYCLSRNVQVVNIYTGETESGAHRYRTRVFAPAFGYLEDPATGSGNAALAYHLFKEGRWDGSPFLMEQGQDRGHPNIIRMTYRDGRVLFGGSATVRIEGSYLI
jgi:PhzF family phenazine biosynthesis protein